MKDPRWGRLLFKAERQNSIICIKLLLPAQYRIYLTFVHHHSLCQGLAILLMGNRKF